MRIIKTIGLAFASLLAFGAIAASASASEFEAHPTNGFPAEATGTQNGTQEFATGSGTITCETLTAKGAVPGSKFESFTAVVTYTKCLADGIAGATVSNVEYLFDANKSVSVLNEPLIDVEATFLTEACSIKIEPQLIDNAVTYENTTAESETINSKATGIHYTANGGVCGEAGVLHTDGAYNGKSVVKIVGGGTLAWIE